MIISIKLNTNRFFSGSYLKDFRIVLGDTAPGNRDDEDRPSGWHFAHLPYRKCGEFNGTPKDYEMSTVLCDDGAVGEYLFLYLPIANHLLFCELKVIVFLCIIFSCLYFIWALLYYSLIKFIC